ncbi:MAG: FAD-binding protein [Alphaproteobacteria bacterium]|nr:FAD-binding protein [Alphaproteobacteria bacterium]
MATTLKPADPNQLRDMVLFMASKKTPAEIVGAGTKRGLGRPLDLDYRIETGALAGIDLYEPEELVMRAGAGTRLAHIERALETHRQQLAFEPIDYGPLLGEPAGKASIGGVFACNLSGPRRVKAGAARDHLLGFVAVSGRGETFKSGGRVVKNVTGYDLCKLMAGSWGTLAVMEQVTFKVLPAPEATATLLIQGLDDRRAIRLLTLALQSPHEVSGAAHLPAGIGAGAAAADIAGPATLLRLEGVPPSVEARVAALGELIGGDGIDILDGAASLAIWRALRDVLPFAGQADRPVWRLSVPPAAGAGVVAAIGAQLPAEAYYDWGGGLIWLMLDRRADAGAGLIRAAVGDVGGHAMLVRATPEVRASVPVFEPQDRAVGGLTRRIKEGFDPVGILNPGRMYAGV